MHISSPARPDELPEPSLLWAMGALSIALDVGLSGWNEPDYAVTRSGLGGSGVTGSGVTRSGHALTEYGILLDDPGGGWWGLARVEGDRYLFLGQERHTDLDLAASPPIDVLEGAPDWLPWAWVTAIDRPDDLVFDCSYWWENGAWSRVAYPDDVSEDGVEMLLDSTRSLQVQVRHFGRGATEGRVEQGRPIREERGTLDLSAEEKAFLPLVEAAAEHRVPAQDLAALLGPEASGRVDVDAFREVLERTGLLAGGPDGIVLPAGLGDRSQRWGPPAIDGGDWHDMVHLAMQDRGELDRPDEEVPETEELRELVGRVRELAGELGGTATCVVAHRVRICRHRLYDGDGRLLKNEHGLDRELGDRASFLLDRLRRAESHSERGSWSLLRLRVTPDGVTTDRVYDHMPGWPEVEGWGFRKPSIADLQREMARRSPEWRPAWVWLLEGEVLHHPPADLLARARGERVPAAPGVTGG